MREVSGTDFGLHTPNDPVSTPGVACGAAISRISQVPPTRLLRFQQSSSDDVQVGERRGHFHAVQVLRQTAVAGLAEAEDILDDPEHVLNLGAHPRLVAVLRFSISLTRPW